MERVRAVSRSPRRCITRPSGSTHCSVSIATPIVRDDLVFVAGYWEGSKAIRLGPQLADATLAWEDKMLRGLMSQPLERDGHVYLLDKQFGLTCFVGLTANVGVGAILVRYGIHEYPAALTGIVIASVWNFALSSKFVWGKY